MSEYQNKAVALMTAHLGAESTADLKKRNEAGLIAAIGLFHALGGEAEELSAIAAAVRAKPTPAVDVAIGDLMRELAAIGTVKDLDIMQAAYNTLDRQKQSLIANPATTA